MSQLCKECQASGLPILPARYAPVPKSVQAGLPGWATAARVKDVALGDNLHYALRTLRAGYVYLFYSKHARGSKLWECYSVTADGLLLKQPSPKAADSPKTSVVCKTAGHSNSRLHHLIIEQPEKCGATWIAFSEYKWSDKTLQRYAGDSKLRSARMQEIDPKAMAAGAANSHGTVASQAALEAIMEYHPGFAPDQLPFDKKFPPFSASNGTYQPAALERHFTRYPLYPRRGKAVETLQFMQVRAKKAAGGSNTPHVMALWDAIGTVQELNGYLGDTAALALAYVQEREFQFGAEQAIENIRKGLTEKAQDSQQRQQDQMMKRDTAIWYQPAEMAQRRAAIAAMPDPVLRQQRLEVCDLLDQWAGWQIPDVMGPQQLNAIDMRRVPEPERSRQIAALKAKVDAFRTQRGENYDKNIDHAGTQTWDKYKAQLLKDEQEGSLQQFITNRGKFDKAVAEQQKKRVASLLNWLSAPLLLDTLEDYHREDPKDGIEFETVVGHSILGINAIDAGQAKLEAWAKDVQIGSANLLYRALAQNQLKIKEELKQVLQQAKQNQETPYAAAVFAAIDNSKNFLQKLFDMYKENSALYELNHKAASPESATAFGVSLRAARTGKIDYVVMTAGNAIFKTFQPAASATASALGLGKAESWVGQKFIQGVLSMRALVRPADFKALAEAEHENWLLRKQALGNGPGSKGALRAKREGLRMIAQREAEFRRNQGKKLELAFQKFGQDAPGEKRAMVKEGRLTLVVALIEGAYIARTIFDKDKKLDADTCATLFASGAALTAMAIDSVSQPLIKVLPGGDQARSIQRLKLIGGLFMAASNLVGVVQDSISMKDAALTGQALTRNLYFAKVVLGGAAISISIASTFTYSAPIILRVSGSVAISETAAAIGGRAVAILAARIVFMTLGSWITLTTFAIQAILWAIQRNDLEIWLSQTPFGVDLSNSKAPKTVLELEKELSKIYKEQDKNERKKNAS
ncbi:T6SS effector BTH_I2691 family protein [Chromobacterium vaccinii]|uniref:T6SS effector BTH_I2691 family protein n=1 Tax=Chromobacterium vaccinii TaxID=1108595 RepID=A0ABV0FFX5_9NEIS